MSTATTTSFNDMLNEYVNNPLLELELAKRNYFANVIPQDKTWDLENNYVLPHIAGNASTVKFGGLTASADIYGSKPLRGFENVHKEMWGSLKFLQKDLLIHGKIDEQNFLKILPDELTRHADTVAQIYGQNLCSGKAIDTVTVNGTAGGAITIANPERVQIQQFVQFASSVVTSPIGGYVSQLNINTGLLQIETAPGSGVAVNLSTILVADNAKMYASNQLADGFNSMIDLLLPASAGGSATIHNLNKLASPQLQGVYTAGGTWTGTTILKEIFKLYVKARKVGKGKPNKVAMSYNNFGACVNVIENQKGAFNVTPKTQSAEQFAWDEINVGGFLSNGEPVKLVAIQEMNDTDIMGFDPSCWVFASAGGMQKQKTPDGNFYFVERDPVNGYSYIVDTFLMGNLFCKQPYKNFLSTGLNITY